MLEHIPQETGLSGPHTYYALPGRMLLSFLGSADGGIPAGLAEFTNDGTFIRRIDNPTDSPYGYDLAIKPEFNRMVTSGFTPMRNYQKPLARMDLADFGSDLVIWDFKTRKPVQKAKVGAAPLEIRWSLKPNANHGFTNCALENSLWLFKSKRGRKLRIQESRRYGSFARRSQAKPRRSLPLRLLFRRQGDRAVGCRRPRASRIEERRLALRTTEHDAPDRRRKKDVCLEFALIEHGPELRLSSKAHSD